MLVESWCTMCWARIISEGNRCYAPWLNDAMAARSGRHVSYTNTLKYE